LTCSPRWEGGTESRFADGAANEDTFEEEPDCSSNPGLKARMTDLKSRGGVSGASGGGSQLSPDRASHDGVEVQRPSSTPSSR
jgi:hypothetical protein